MNILEYITEFGPHSEICWDNTPMSPKSYVVDMQYILDDLGGMAGLKTYLNGLGHPQDFIFGITGESYYLNDFRKLIDLGILIDQGKARRLDGRPEEFKRTKP